MKKPIKLLDLRLGPDDAYLITRGLRTLDVRLDKHEKSAREVANFLSKYKNIKLLYPHIKKIHLILECGKNIIQEHLV